MSRKKPRRSSVCNPCVTIVTLKPECSCACPVVGGISGPDLEGSSGPPEAVRCCYPVESRSRLVAWSDLRLEHWLE